VTAHAVSEWYLSLGNLVLPVLLSSLFLTCPSFFFSRQQLGHFSFLFVSPFFANFFFFAVLRSSLSPSPYREYLSKRRSLLAHFPGLFLVAM